MSHGIRHFDVFASLLKFHTLKCNCYFAFRFFVENFFFSFLHFKPLCVCVIKRLYCRNTRNVRVKLNLISFLQISRHNSILNNFSVVFSAFITRRFDSIAFIPIIFISLRFLSFVYSGPYQFLNIQLIQILIYHCVYSTYFISSFSCSTFIQTRLNWICWVGVNWK